MSWKLWDCTRQSLDEHKAASGDRLLLTSKGTTWVGEGRRDVINSLYRHLGFPGPLKQFRASAGNMIMKKFGKETADHFLGHKQGVVDSAYFAREQKELDKAVVWLGSHLGLSRGREEACATAGEKVLDLSDHGLGFALPRTWLSQPRRLM